MGPPLRLRRAAARSRRAAALSAATTAPLQDIAAPLLPRRAAARSPLAAASAALQLAALLLFCLCRLAGGGSVLMKSVTRNGLVTAGGAKYYRVQLTCPDTALSLDLSLLALQGAPVLYLSTTLQHPGPAVGFNLNSSSALSVAYPDAGLYYLAVYGANASVYKLSARVSLSTGARIAAAARRDVAARR
jgi:hypothetical protein